jgi:hypothetical protein
MDKIRIKSRCYWERPEERIGGWGPLENMIGTQGYHIGNRKERKKTPPTPKPKKQKKKN